MMAQPVPHQATDKKRVKVYELRNNDWYDRGTGFCTAIVATTDDGIRDPRVVVESEDHPDRLLLETSIQKEDGFQKQQDTLIVWQDPASGVDMALSFQEPEGCAMIWRFVFNAQQALQSNNNGADDGLSDDLAIEPAAAISLPAAELGNLVEIDTMMRNMSATGSGREALTKFIMTDDYIGKLIPLVELAEDFESVPDLHRLCNIMKTIILLNDTSIIEHAVSDECLLGVVGALEYDPDFPSHKANHRQWLSKERFKEVVPIQDEQTLRKIHQTYRLQYLKDVVLARILDDPTFSVLNSLIFFNQVDIVSYIQSNAPFLTQLFGIFTPSCTDHKKRKDAVLFIQQCCSIAKSLQPPARQSMYHNLMAHGLMNVIHFGLRHADAAVRVGATDILLAVIDHEPQAIRQTAYRQMHEGPSSALIDTLIELILIEMDLGVKSQILEALKVLLDQSGSAPGQDNFPKANGEFAGRPRPQPSADPQQELFLTRFYERSAPKLFKPLLDLEHRSDMNFEAYHSTIFSYLVEILCFFIRQHHRFSRYFVMTCNIVQRIAQLLKSPEKCLRLVAIRFFRAVIGLQDEFYIKNLIEKNVLVPVLEIVVETLPRDNLLSSACLELFEYIKKENLKDLLKHLVVNNREQLVALSNMSTFRDLVLRYDQNQGYTENMDYLLETEDVARRPPSNTRLTEQITVDPREEDYWDGSDPEDENDDQHGAPDEKTPAAKRPSTPSKLLVDYTSDEEADESPDGEGEQGGAKDGSEASAVFSPRSSVSGVSPPERLSEKRRREEDDEDELGKLMHSKRRNSTSAESNSSIASGLAQRRKSFTTGVGNGAPKKIAISLSPALRTGGGPRSNDES